MLVREVETLDCERYIRARRLQKPRSMSALSESPAIHGCAKSWTNSLAVDYTPELHIGEIIKLSSCTENKISVMQIAICLMSISDLLIHEHIPLSQN